MRKLELMGITYGSLFPGIEGVCRDMRDRLFSSPAWSGHWPKTWTYG